MDLVRRAVSTLGGRGPSRLNGIRAVMAVVLIGCGILLALWNIWLPFSFWADELASVGEASHPFGSMIDLIVIDNHPPLYVSLLALWMRLFGSSEFAVHALSAVSALAGLAYLYVWSERLSASMRWTLLTLHCTNLAFCYYAQEARSYSQLLSISIVLTTAFVSNIDTRSSFRLLLVAGFVCSLTHYYGLVMTGIIFLYCLIVLRRHFDKVAWTVIVGLSCLIWPIYHTLHANLLGRKTDFPWIGAPWPRDSIDAYLGAFTPGLAFLFGKIPVFSVALTLAAFLAFIGITLYLLGARPIDRNGAWKQDALPVHRLSYLLLMGILATATIDYFSKTTISKYLSCYVPAFEILLSYFLANKLSGSALKSLAGVAATGVIGASSLYVSYGSLAAKHRSSDPWKQNAQAVAAVSQPFPRYFLINQSGHFPPSVAFDQTNFYMTKYRSRYGDPTPIFSSKIYALKPPYILIYDDIGGDQIHHFDNSVCQRTGCRHLVTNAQNDTQQLHGLFIVDRAP